MKRVIKAVQKHISEDEGLLKSSSVFLVGSLLAAAFNYLYHLFMGRMLGPKEYGVLGSLFAIIYLVSFSAMTFNNVISKYTAEFHGKKEMSYLKRLIQRAFYKCLVFGAVSFIIYAVLAPQIADFMKIENILAVVLVGLIAYLSLVSAILIGALNGLQKFVWQNISGFASVFLKFSLAVLLVYFSFGVNGALIALLIGVIISISISLYPIRNFLKHIKSKKFESKKIYLYAIPVFFASVFPILLITLDHILVKHFFSSTEAGYYAAAGMIAKIIWFGSGFFVGAFFPKIVGLAVKGKDTSKLLTKCLTYVLILIAAGCSLYFIMPTFIVSILYGQEYSAVISLIGVFGIAMGFFSLTQILVIYNLAVEKYGFIWIILASVLVEVIGISLFHKTIFDVVKVFFVANLFLLIGMLMYNKKEVGVSFA